MPQSFNDFINNKNNSQPTSNVTAPSTPSTSRQSFNDFVNSDNSKSTAGQQSFNNFATSGQGTPQAADTGGNLFSKALNVGKKVAGAAASFVGNKFNQFENATGLNHVAGAMKGFTDPTFSKPVEPSGNSLADLWKAVGTNVLHTVGDYGKSVVHGFTNPDDTTQKFNTDLENNTKNLDPVTRTALKFTAQGATDPMSYFPVGLAAKAVSRGVKVAADASGATPYITKALNATKAAPGVKQTLQTSKDIVGKMFTPNYGASPALVDALKEGAGQHAVNQVSILNALQSLAKDHGLSQSELDEIGPMIEKTQGPFQSVAQQQMATSISDMLRHGAAGSKTGTSALTHATSAVTGEPLLPTARINYFPHQYKQMPDELKGVFPKQGADVPGLSPQGTYNMPRTFDTIGDAQHAGLKPELNPFTVAGEHLNQTSKALTNNDIIAKIKNTPGLLFDKDPIDEVAKLVKTGRMTADQAAAHLGMSLEDLKKGFVQSKVPQLSGAYIRPADEAALVEHLNPSKASGLLGFTDKVNNLFNKGFLLNPLPHMHNVLTNGLGLGEANPNFVKETFGNLSKGIADPHYTRALKSGAISSPVGGAFTKAIKRVTEDSNNILTIGKNASHNLLWNTDASLRTALHRGGLEAGMTDAEAAAHTNKFMVDYHDLTPFEKKYIKPIINFYSWKKGNVPLQMSQMLAQTPKYALYNHAKDAISQEMSGNPTDSKGRMDPNQQLSDGSHTMIDDYSPMGEMGKIADKGVIPWLYNSMNPGIKEGIDQVSSLAQAAGLPLQNKFPIYNKDAPLSDNLEKGAAHAANTLNPLSGSAAAGIAGANQSNLINRLFGQKTKDVPNTTITELITKLLGGFTGRVNPVKDATNAAYDQRDSVLNHIKYEKSKGIYVSKAEKKAAYKKIG